MEETNPENRQTKDIPIKWRGKDEVVTIKKMGFREKNDFWEKTVETTAIGQTLQVTIHTYTMRTKSLQICVIKAPFGIKDEELDKITDNEEMKILNKICDEIEKFNHLSPEQQKNLNGALNTEQAKEIQTS